MGYLSNGKIGSLNINEKSEKECTIPEGYQWAIITSFLHLNPVKNSKIMNDNYSETEFELIKLFEKMLESKESRKKQKIEQEAIRYLDMYSKFLTALSKYG